MKRWPRLMLSASSSSANGPLPATLLMFTSKILLIPVNLRREPLRYSMFATFFAFHLWAMAASSTCDGLAARRRIWPEKPPGSGGLRRTSQSVKICPRPIESARASSAI